MYLSLIPSHAIAGWLLNHIDRLLDHFGLAHQESIEELIYVIIIVAFSLLVGWLVKRAILFVATKAVALREGSMGHELLRQHTLTKCSHIIPPLVFLGMLPFAFISDNPMLVIIEKLAIVYTLICLAIGINAVFSFVFLRINQHENERNLPLKGILNIAIGIVWIVIAIISISVLIGKSPVALLTGLGAFAAALMLIFKDSILGFVAGIQMSENDMLRVGDWIVIPSTPANGIVEDVTLSTVKVRNWDNTLVMVPPYTLVSTSFQNYRGMSETGVRRILQSFIIDLTTVRPADETMIEKAKAAYPELDQFIEQAKKQADTAVSLPDVRGLDGSLQSNLGLYRAYVCSYLLNHPRIARDQRVMVRLQEANTSGIPLNIWCFTDTANFDAYEAIRSEVTEHIILSAAAFDLGIYSSASLVVETEQK